MSNFARQTTNEPFNPGPDNSNASNTNRDENNNINDDEASNLNENYLILMLYVDDTFEYAAHLKQIYIQAIEDHNSKLVNNRYPDAGFDLFLPLELNPEKGKVNMVDLKVKTSMCILGDDGNRCIPLSYYMYPRSSMSKTPLRMANSIGIIDSGYRGTLKVPLDYMPELNVESCAPNDAETVRDLRIIYGINASDTTRYNEVTGRKLDSYTCQKHTRLVQICSPDLKPIFVKMVEHEHDLDFLDAPSERGAGGLGSTGI